MINKEKSRQRRARATRARIKLQKVNRLSIHRTNLHIYASIISADGGRVLVSASTVEREVRDQLAAAKSEAIATAATDATTKADKALSDAKTYADGLNTAMDGRVKETEKALAWQTIA